MVGRSAPRPAEVGILIGRIRSLVVKNMTIGIEEPLTTTPENGQRLDGMRRSTPITASVKLAVIDAL